jgi:hypothetical protein
MPSFAGALADRDVADIANYIRVSWANKASPDASTALVASVRAASQLGVAGSEAARDFDCPKVGASTVPGALIGAGDVDLMAGPGDAGNRIDELVFQLRKQQPGISAAALTNSMIAAICPSVANAPALTTAQKRARLLQLGGTIQDAIAMTPP